MAYRTLVVRGGELGTLDYRGSFLGSIVKGVGHFVGGVASGVVAAVTGGGIVGGIKAIAQYDQKAGVLPAPVATAGPLTPPPPPTMALQPPTGGPGTITSPGGTVVNVAAHGAALMAAGGRGHHLNKSWTYSRKTGQLAAPGTKLVKNRRMNWANGRAMGRAEHRIHSFVKHARRYIRWVSPKKKGSAHPRFGKKK
jgi:hypothetical protein